MADVYKKHIETLREKSRTLLARLKKNSQVIDYEINKLHSQRSSVTSENQQRVREGNFAITKSWKIRNDSSGVGGLLCPDIFCSSVRNNINEQGDMTVGGRILITSKRPVGSLPLRKPIKGCYCNHEPRKILYRSPRTIHKPNWQCDYCKSDLDVRVTRTYSDDQDNPSPALSCKTLQKVQRINYTPRSEFLRRVQKKVSQNYNICTVKSSEPALQSPQLNGNACDDGSQRSDCISNNSSHEADYRSCVREADVLNLSKDMKLPKTLKGTRSNSDFTKLSNVCPCESQTGVSDRRSTVTRPKSKSRETKIPDDVSFNEIKCVRASNIQTIFPSCRRSMSKISPRKTIISTKQPDNAPATDIPPKSSSRSKKKSRVLTQKTSCCIDCCPVKKRMKNSTNASKKSDRSNCTKCCRCSSRLCPAFVPQDDSTDPETTELRKFREKNYFDTHGSRQTLLSSPQSSGSLEQFQINERLFPESIGKVHRDDFVVSMPICATKQLKRIHYFPRHVVKQQKNSEPTVCHSKKGRYRSCPLTGHTIDLGALKVPCPVNSLALKFQKGVV